MAKTTRSKEIWHIPKRGSVHQTIYMVYCLTWDKFSKKSWSSGKQEMMASEMGKAGVTDSGEALTHQSVRTLLANIPKYLGFIYIDQSTSPSRIVVTEVGSLLIDHHQIEKIPKHRNLSEYKQAGDLIETSELFELQMAKLIITNPIINNDCQKILVFPFRMTLKLLLELDYLDCEEIAYFLFHTKSEDEYDLRLQQIINFRNLPSEGRQAEIDAYKKTEEGILTLVKAPTSGYFMYLCCSTGICKKISRDVNKLTHKKLTALELVDKSLAMEIIDKFQKSEIYDFNENTKLWIDYFSNPNKLEPPFDITINFDLNNKLFVCVYKDGELVHDETLGENVSRMVFPAFHGEDYEIKAFGLDDGSEVLGKIITADRNCREFQFRVSSKRSQKPLTVPAIVKKIEEVTSGKFKGFDKEYYTHLEVLGKLTSKNFIDNFRLGGRFEFLFFSLLSNLQEENKIDEVYWYGKIGKYDLAEPAPGGPTGNPDIVFIIDKFTFVLELTTIRGNRNQWNGSEASSVPDHIRSYKKNHPTENVIGIFSAPSIHCQLERSLRLNAQDNNVGMLFIQCVELANVLIEMNKEELLQFLLDRKDDQLAS